MGTKGKQAEPARGLQQKGKGYRYREKGGTRQSAGLDESLQKRLKVCCRKISGTDRSILLGLFTLQQ